MYRKARLALPFLIPGLAGILIFYVVPFFGGIWYSLTDGSFENKFVGAENYIKVWGNQMFQLGLKNTMELSLICAPSLFLLSFLLSLLLNRIRPAGTFFRSSVLLPYLMPSSAVLIIWLLWFDYGGPVNHLISLCGGQRVLWLQGAELRVPVVLLFLWKNLGFCIIIFLAALQAIPISLYEYADLEGAGFWKQAFNITLPMIVPSAFLVFIICWVNAFRIFKEVYFIGGAYPEEPLYTLQNYMSNMYSKLNYQNVTTAAYIFAAIVFALFGLLFFLQNRAQRGLN
ncbi:MAG: sugar ABC transporter permease [Clostridia bacterium]|nr:sugar ABC transporter permease [Clostridia bacterium]MBR2602851.1 sugar ABC transporter permease [Clostridia bacterium]MBR2662080.1 sugar ABC transporter permease [Clostridia bacterium]MBR7174174.1 sugar ABC transporter permease [Clostridia bacterium]